MVLYSAIHIFLLRQNGALPLCRNMNHTYTFNINKTFSLCYLTKSGSGFDTLIVNLAFRSSMMMNCVVLCLLLRIQLLLTSCSGLLLCPWSCVNMASLLDTPDFCWTIQRSRRPNITLRHGFAASLREKLFDSSRRHRESDTVSPLWPLGSSFFWGSGSMAVFCWHPKV